MGMGCSFRGYKSTDRLAVPGTVTKASAFGSGEACAKRTDQQRRRQPKRQLRGCLPGGVEIALGLRYDLIDALLGIGLAKAGSCGHNLRVRPETSGRIAEFSEHEAD